MGVGGGEQDGLEKGEGEVERLDGVLSLCALVINGTNTRSIPLCTRAVAIDYP